MRWENFIPEYIYFRKHHDVVADIVDLIGHDLLGSGWQGRHILATQYCYQSLIAELNQNIT